MASVVRQNVSHALAPKEMRVVVRHPEYEEGGSGLLQAAAELLGITLWMNWLL